MSIYIHKSHNVTVLLYHLVCPTKYRRIVVTPGVEQVLKETCIGIGMRYDLHFLEIGTDMDHAHFLIQTVPMMLPTKMVRTIKSITAKKIFGEIPSIRTEFWGGQFWSDGYYLGTVGRTNSETAVRRYVKQQGRAKEYVMIHKDQLKIF